MRHGVPTSAELADALRGFLREDVTPAVDARLGFLARVAANVVSQLEREIELGPARTAAHAERVAALGVADDDALVQAIRDGSLDHRRDELLAAVRADVVERLRISNPRHLRREDQVP